MSDIQDLHSTNQSKTNLSQSTTDVMGEHSDSGGEVPVWFMERVCVTLKKGNSEGTIRTITGDNLATVAIDDENTVDARPSEMSLVQPKEHDTVLVTGGVDVGMEGELVCIDGTDAILKDAGEDYKIVDFSHLAKIKEV